MKEEELNTIENEIFNGNNETKLIKESDIIEGKNLFVWNKHISIDNKKQNVADKNAEKRSNGTSSKYESKSEKMLKEEEDALENEHKIKPSEISDAERLKIILNKIAKGQLKNSYGQAIEKSSNEAQTTKM